MIRIKLVDGTILGASAVELAEGVLRITTEELTVEELAGLFSNKGNTSLIVFLDDDGAECGYRAGFTSFAGIDYSADGVKTVGLFQPTDTTEERISRAEGMANLASAAAESLISEVTDTQLAIAELAAIITGGLE